MPQNPAHAGMNPYAVVPEDVSGPKPRSRGDEPSLLATISAALIKTPLTRG